MPSVSKSRYVAGLQCRKLFWTTYKAKELIPPIDAATQAVFDQGHEVGGLAKTRFPQGIEIEGDPWDFAGLIARTRAAMKKRVPLYEAAFGSANAFARADIMVPVEENAWDIVEVKSSTEVKPVHITDMSLQRFAAEGAGLTIRKCFLMRVDNTYVRKGPVDPKKLFALEDVTARVAEELPNVGKKLAELLDLLRRDEAPDVKIGPHCDDPYTCALHDVCWAFLPENNPLRLNGFRKDEAFRLIHEGLLNLEDVPDLVAQTEKQLIQIETARSGELHVDPYRLRAFLKGLEYPLYFLDFETFQTAIPLFDGVRPYQQIPFQYSLHIVGSPGASPDHRGYLSEGNADPRPEFLARLAGDLGDKGSIVCYNAAFERGILEASVASVPEYAPWWKSAKKRFVDLLEPFRSFAVYHPGQRGSASLKSVLPAVTGGPGYEGLEIKDGGTASWEYLRVTFGRAALEERILVRKQLEEYCGLDTEAMIRLINTLESLDLKAGELPKKKPARKRPT